MWAVRTKTTACAQVVDFSMACGMCDGGGACMQLKSKTGSCRNNCSDSILFQYLCYLFIDSMDIRFEISSKNVLFYDVFKLREFITKLMHAIDMLLNLNQFSIKN